jgi:hypothetical protein
MNQNNNNDNIINFPKNKLTSINTIQTQEDLIQQISDYKTKFADEISEILSNLVFGELARSGVDFENNIDEYFPSIVLVTESILALHLRSSGIFHPLQEFADDVFGIDDDDEEVDNEVDNEEEVEYKDENETLEGNPE